MCLRIAHTALAVRGAGTGERAGQLVAGRAGMSGNGGEQQPHGETERHNGVQCNYVIPGPAGRGRTPPGHALITVTNCKLQITSSTSLILYNQDDNITSDALTRDMHLQLTRYQMTDPR